MSSMEEHKKKKTKLFNSISSARLKYVKLDHIFLISIICMVLTHLPITHFFAQIIICLAIFISICFMGRPRSVYLVDFACHKPGPEQKCSRELCVKRTAEIGCFTEDSLHFMRKILEKSGYGDMTYGPKGLMRNPKDQSLVESIEETEMVMYGAVDELLEATGIEPREIGILVVNSSLFNPTPSLSARILNHYKFRENILSYSLAGMGCSAGLISIDLAKHLLQVNRNTYALIVSTENITRNFYKGNQRPMLVTNCLFRVGAAAILLSNNPIDYCRSKYQLIHTIRTHLGASDKSFNCVMQQEDDNQIVGVSLSKDLMEVAGEALKANITALGPLVLPLSEKLKFLMTNIIGKRVFKLKIKSYIPDFKLAFEHFCIHAGGRGVLDELEKNLQLTKWHMEPSRMTLYRYGNTSSSSLWYELAYSEAKGRVKKGERVWQLGFGSGFKCNSVVWRALRSVHPDEELKNNPWIDEVDQFPVDVPQNKPIVY